jgi:collagen beta-1,O-galactosyltransferase
MEWRILFCLLGTVLTFWGCWAAASSDPVVFVTLLARNKAHTLPYFLHLLEQLDYPKDKLILWWVPLSPLP